MRKQTLALLLVIVVVRVVVALVDPRARLPRARPLVEGAFGAAALPLEPLALPRNVGAGGSLPKLSSLSSRSLSTIRNSSLDVLGLGISYKLLLNTSLSCSKLQCFII